MTITLERERERERERQTETETETERDRDRETERDRDRQTDRDRDRETETDRQTDFRGRGGDGRAGGCVGLLWEVCVQNIVLLTFWGKRKKGYAVTVYVCIIDLICDLVCSRDREQ